MNTSLADLVRYWASLDPQRAAIRFDGETTTWLQLDERSDAIARGLQEAGFQPGDRLGVLSQNRPEFLEVVVAAMKLGVITVPLNYRLAAAEISYIVDQAACRGVVVEDDLLPLTSDIDRDHRPLIGIDGSGDLTLDSLRLDGEPIDVALSADDPVLICYTSGTTGFPKGAVLTSRNVLAHGLGRAAVDCITRLDVQLIVLPLALTGGICTCWLSVSVVSGATAVIERTFEPERGLKLIETEGVSVTTLPPIFYEQMAALPEFDSRDLSSLRSVLVGGAPVTASLLARYHEKHIQMTQAYGLTECTGATTLLSSDQAADNLGYAGRPMIGSGLRVVDADGVDCPPGVPGEIILKGDHVMVGYWDNPDATAAALRDGWLYSGDVGEINEAGFLRVVDRSKDMLISGGINVYPAEIERAIGPLPSVAEYVVIGVPDEKWGEVPMVVIGGPCEELPIEEIAERCTAKLGKYKRPKYVGHVEALPRNAMGKVLKQDLRARFAQLGDDVRPIGRTPVGS